MNAAKFYRDAAKALEDAEYILFGRDDHFHHAINSVTDALGPMPAGAEAFMNAVRRGLLANAERLEDEQKGGL